MNRKYIWYAGLTIVVGVFLVAVIIFSAKGRVTQKKPTPIYIDENTYYPVTRVIDGDTFNAKVGEKEITVRMLGINTPETVDPRKPPECFGKEASDETKLLLGHMKVQLKLNPKREVLDKYGRYLAYIYREDGLFINEYLLKDGFAKEYTYGKPYSEQRNFKKAEKKAQGNKVGLWERCYTNDTKIQIITNNTSKNSNGI
ncbi:MAG: thermonuclease family protein [Patescibacteria group bacterium]